MLATLLKVFLQWICAMNYSLPLSFCLFFFFFFFFFFLLLLLLLLLESLPLRTFSIDSLTVYYYRNFTTINRFKFNRFRATSTIFCQSYNKYFFIHYSFHLFVFRGDIFTHSVVKIKPSLQISFFCVFFVSKGNILDFHFTWNYLAILWLLIINHTILAA